MKICRTLKAIQPLGEVFKPGRTLTADDLVDVDALMIRSVTKVNAELISSKQAEVRWYVTAAWIMLTKRF